MQSLIIKPDNKEKLDALIALMKAFKIPFEEQKTYDPEFVKMVLQGEDDIKEEKELKIDSI